MKKLKQIETYNKHKFKSIIYEFMINFQGTKFSVSNNTLEPFRVLWSL